MPPNDDTLIYDYSLKPVEELSACHIQRTKKFTYDYAKKIQLSALSIMDKRGRGQDHWKLISRSSPPCFVNLLFSDGEQVVIGRINDMYDLNATKFNPVIELDNETALVVTWWRLMPEGPREYYGFP